MAARQYNILIVNDIGRNVLASIRSLGRKKCLRLDAAIQEGKPTYWVRKVLKSRYLNRLFSIPDPNADFQGFKRAVLGLLARKHYHLVLPYGFKTTVALAEFKKELEARGVIFPFPDLDTVMKAHDKENCVRLAREIGLGIPHTYFHSTLEDLMAQDIEFPVVIKARRNSGVGKGFAMAANREELARRYRKMDSLGRESFLLDYSRPLVQKYINGHIYDACVFFTRGKVRQFVFQRRVLCYKGGIGPGVLNQTVKGDLAQRAYRYGSRLLEHLDWTGSCQIELIHDLENDDLKLIELNPKLWGTLELSIKAGVDFPWEMIRCFLLQQDGPCLDYREVSFYWLYDYFRSKIMTRQKARLKEIKDILFKYQNEIQWSDPGPEISHLGALALWILKGRLKLSR